MSLETFKEAMKELTDKVGTHMEEKINYLHLGYDRSVDITKARIEAGITLPDLQGTKVYNVHFVEYTDGKKTTDIPVFVASSPEWAMGYCKSHLEIAVKNENTINGPFLNWWYFYITEMEINSEEAEAWIATIDWNGKLVTNTYHIDKGYGYDYKKEHVIYEQECGCEQHEKDEEAKIAERTEAALTEAQKFLKDLFFADSTIVKKDGDWYKIWAVNPSLSGYELKISDYEYKCLHRKYGIVAGNRILFYLTKVNNA